jgi:sporulation protein YtfJ
MENHPIENLMRSTMENIRDMVDVNTIIGDAVDTGEGSIIIPVSKVSFGFASGGSEFASNCEKDLVSKYPFGGGCGAGVSVKPVAFLVIKNDNVRLLSVDHDNTYDRIVDTVPQVIEMLKGMGKNKEQVNKEDKLDNNHDNPFMTSDTI